MKLAIVSHVLPPSWSGQAMALHRLLADVEPHRYCLISRQDYGEDNPAFADGLRLPGEYHHLPSEAQLPTGQRFGIGRITALLNLVLRIATRARRITAILRQENCSTVVACTGDLADPPAAYLASRRIGVPFYLHAFDDYVYQWTVPWKRTLARWSERFIMRGTVGVIVPNEFMGEAYAKRHAAATHLVRNPSLSIGTGDEIKTPWPARTGEIRIIYTGAVYHAHHDAFRNLIAALALLGRSDIHVHMYTAQTRTQLEQEGIRGPMEIHHHLTPIRSRDVQQQADILFLPLAFESPVQEVVRTSAPGKLGEYLASGRPLLVHAPADSFVSWYCKQQGCGIVVDENRPEALAAGIRSILEDEALRKRMLEQASVAAKQDFSLPGIRAAYWAVFETSRGG